MTSGNLEFKIQVAQSFSRAAKSYDRVAHLQRHVARRLRENCPYRMSGEPAVLLDAGCGTGKEWMDLIAQFQPAMLVGLDIADGMALYAMEHAPRNLCRFGSVVGDLESLPLADGSIDYFHSTLAVQWCEAFSQMLESCYRCLRPGGVAMISTLLDGTLLELEAAWKKVDQWQHVNQFMTLAQLKDSLGESSWAMEGNATDLQTEQIVLEYDSVRGLTSELKALGAHNVTPGRKRSVMSRSAVRDFVGAYEKFRMANGRLPASYEVAYFYLKKGV